MFSPLLSYFVFLSYSIYEFTKICVYQVIEIILYNVFCSFYLVFTLLSLAIIVFTICHAESQSVYFSANSENITLVLLLIFFVSLISVGFDEIILYRHCWA